MGILGFSFLKFDAERKSPSKASGNIEINHNVSIKNVTKTKLKVGTNENEVLKIEFEFMVLYTNGLGKISIVGDVIYSDTKEIINETIKSWDADKKLNKMVNEPVFKFVYNKAIIKALDISDSLNLPSPVPMPKINFSNDKKKA